VQPLFRGFTPPIPRSSAWRHDAGDPAAVSRARKFAPCGRGKRRPQKNQADASEVSSIGETRPLWNVCRAAGGMSSLVDAIARRLPEGVIQSRHADIKHSSATRATVGNWTSSKAVIRTLRCGRRCIASARGGAPRSAGGRELAGELAQIEYAGCAVVCLGYRRDQIGECLLVSDSSCRSWNAANPGGQFRH